MRIITNDIAMSGNTDEFRLHHLTDLHDGARDHAKEALDARILEIANDPKAYWVGGGDYGDLINPTDPRFQADMVDPELLNRMHRIPDFYLERLTKRLQPIAGKCLAFVIGNHETAIAKHYHRGVGAELASRLGIADKYTGYRGWAVLRFNQGTTMRTSLKLFHYHGWQGGRSKGRKALQGERDLGAWDADIFMLGHDHQPDGQMWITQEMYHSGTDYKIRNKHRVHMNGGAWVGGDPTISPPIDPDELSLVEDPSWASKKNFRPDVLGGPVLRVIVKGKINQIDYVIENRSGF